ncbi:MAG: ParB/RepB/Spo0J family partition protein [Deltaproteobacteria bacterium]|nr:ParB/RepB/Spo0J family partition protein [Deltaproteobacteria bacterium]
MEFRKISVESISEGYHPRQNSSGQDELKASIEREGRLLDPITIRPVEGNRFIIIDGRRRLQTVKELGWTEIDGLVETVDEKTATHLSFVKNTERENLSPIDIANHLRAMLDHFGYNVEDLVRLGYAPHRASLDNHLNLLKLPEDIQGQISEGMIHKSCGYQLTRIDDPEVQRKLAQEIVSKKNLSTREVKKKVDSLNASRNEKEEDLEIPIPQKDMPGVFFKDSGDMSELPDQSVNLIVTSPSHQTDFEYEKGASLENHFKMMDEVFTECGRVLAPGGTIFLNFVDIHNYGPQNNEQPEIFKMGPRYQEMLRKHGIRLTDEIIWEKAGSLVNNPQPSFSDRLQHTSYRILSNTEHLWVFRKDGKREVSAYLEYKSKITREEWKEWVKGIWRISAVSSQKDHPAQLPEELISRAIRMFSYKGDKVLDPFLGSGTTMKVAQELGRVGIGYEKEEQFKPVIMKKLGMDISTCEADQIDSGLAANAEVFDAVVNQNEVLPRNIKDLGTNTILLGDCLYRLKEIPDHSIDQIVTDSPYGLGMMGKEWDDGVPDVDIWLECFRVLKPGSFACIMSSPRQDLYARMCSNLVAAGFKTDFSPIYWTYATGFPKAHSTVKEIDNKQGRQLKIVAASTSDEAKPLSGAYLGFQPKPAVEPIIVVMKPITKRSYIDEALATGKGITWLDNCRIPFESGDIPAAGHRTATFGTLETIPGGDGSGSWDVNSKGRFPANLLVSDDVLDADKNLPVNERYSRFFSLDAWAEKCLPTFLIAPKPSRTEKEMGLEDFEDKIIAGRDPGQDVRKVPHKIRPTGRKNTHLTIKPLKLMAYLITLFSSPGDVILDPFAGSGTTCIAAKILDRNFIGIELSEEYHKIAVSRVENATKEMFKEVIEIVSLNKNGQIVIPLRTKPDIKHTITDEIIGENQAAEILSKTASPYAIDQAMLNRQWRMENFSNSDDPVKAKTTPFPYCDQIEIPLARVVG